VVGVEFVDTAVQAFWDGLGVTPQTDEFHGFIRSTHGPITLLQGDIFHLQETHTGTIDAIYDRAGIIAIPPDQQERYAGHMLRLLKPGGQMLLISYDMPLPPEQGPPFSIHPDKMPALFAAASEVSCLQTLMLTPEEEPKLIKRGAAWAREGVWRIER